MGRCDGSWRILGRTLSPEDLFDLPERDTAATYPALRALLQRRRRIREFQARPVEHERIEQILAAAQRAPIGIPPPDVHVLVLDEREKVNAFARDVCDDLEGLHWLVSGWRLWRMRPVWGKAHAARLRDFVRPMLGVYPRNLPDPSDGCVARLSPAPVHGVVDKL